MTIQLTRAQLHAFFALIAAIVIVAGVILTRL